MLIVPSPLSLSLNHTITGWLPVYTITHTHREQRAVREWNLSETKVLARLSCAACSSRFMRSKRVSLHPQLCLHNANTHTLFLLGHKPELEILFHLFFVCVWRVPVFSFSCVETNGLCWLANVKVGTGYTGIVFTERGGPSVVHLFTKVSLCMTSYEMKSEEESTSWNSCGKTLFH